MERREFSREAPGELAPVSHGGRATVAFVPHPLPPSIEWTPDLVEAVTKASWALGQLNGIGGQLENPHLLIRQFLRKEAVLSSRIEGTVTTLRELMLFEASRKDNLPPPGADPIDRRGAGVDPSAPDVADVHNYVAAVEHGLSRMERFPLALRLIRELHGILMQEARGQSHGAGEFRTTQNWIGRPGCGIDGARFVPPPPDRLRGCLNELERYLNRSGDRLPLLVRMAISHYQFEAIHPFADGNGRIGRLLLTLLLCRDRLLSHPLLYLSAYFERRRTEYTAHLLAVSQRGEWEAWILFFLEGIRLQADDAIHRIARLQELRRKYHAGARTPRQSALVPRLVDHLFGQPAVTASEVARVLGVTPPTAQRTIDLLRGRGILEEATGRKWGRVYLARGILQAVDDPIP